MQVIDVMRRLNSEQEIRFLLTAYLETLRAGGADKRLPPGVATLPLNDAEDIESRFTELLGAELTGLAHSHCDTQGAIAREATQIFGAAFTRLQTLRDNGSVSARSDPFVAFADGVRPDAAHHQNLAVAI